MPESRADTRQVSKADASPANLKTTAPAPSQKLAQVALGLAIYSVLGPLGLLCPPLGIGFYLCPVALVLSIVALVRAKRHPRRFGGKRPAVAAIGVSLVGTAVNLMVLASFQAHYGPWGDVRQAHAAGSLRCMRDALRRYAETHEGLFPPDLATLADAADGDPGMLHLFGAEPTTNALTDFHYVSGLAQRDPGRWVLLYADSSLFDNKGGAILCVDDTIALVDEPEFGERIQRFISDFQEARGHLPVVLEPK